MLTIYTCVCVCVCVHVCLLFIPRESQASSSLTTVMLWLTDYYQPLSFFTEYMDWHQLLPIIMDYCPLLAIPTDFSRTPTNNIHTLLKTPSSSFPYSCRKPIVKFIYRMATIWLCYTVTHVRCSIVSSASVRAPHKTQQTFPLYLIIAGFCRSAWGTNPGCDWLSKSLKTCDALTYTKGIAWGILYITIYIYCNFTVISECKTYRTIFVYTTVFLKMNSRFRNM